MKLFTLHSTDGSSGTKQHFSVEELEGKSLCGLELEPTCFEVDLDEEAGKWYSCKKCINKAKQIL